MDKRRGGDGADRAPHHAPEPRIENQDAWQPTTSDPGSNMRNDTALSMDLRPKSGIGRN
jgi:hypothetical protein